MRAMYSDTDARSQPAALGPEHSGDLGLAVVLRQRQRGETFSVFYPRLDPGRREQKLAHLDVPEPRGVVQRGVPIGVPHVRVHAQVLRQRLGRVRVAPVRSLVDGGSAGAGVTRVQIDVPRQRHYVHDAVHARLAKLPRARVAFLHRGASVHAREVGARGGTQRQQPRIRGGEVPEEGFLVSGVELGERPEVRVGLECDVGGQHHQLASLHVGVLELSVPLAGFPGVVDEVPEVLVIESQRRSGPLAVVSRPHEVASPERVRAGERDDVPVGHTHTVEDVTEVGGALGGVGQAAVRGATRSVAVVGPAERVRDVGSTRELDGQGTRQGEDVSLGHVRVLLVHLVEHVADDAEPSVGGVGLLRLEPHGAAVRSAAPVPGVEGSRRVPRHAARDGEGDHLVVEQSILDVPLEIREPSGVDHGGRRARSMKCSKVCPRTRESAKRPLETPRDTDGARDRQQTHDRVRRPSRCTRNTTRRYHDTVH